MHFQQEIAACTEQLDSSNLFEHLDMFLAEIKGDIWIILKVKSPLSH